MDADRKGIRGTQLVGRLDHLEFWPKKVDEIDICLEFLETEHRAQLWILVECGRDVHDPEEKKKRVLFYDAQLYQLQQ